MTVEAYILYLNISLNEKWWCYKDVFHPKAIQIETYSNFASNYELLFFNLVQIHNYIGFFFSLLKDQKKFESISLRTSAKFELVIIFVCHMYVCSAGSYNQTNICFSWSFNRGFFLMNNIMILMLMRVHGNFVQQVVTKFNEWYQ